MHDPPRDIDPADGVGSASVLHEDKDTDLAVTESQQLGETGTAVTFRCHNNKSPNTVVRDERKGCGSSEIPRVCPYETCNYQNAP